MTFSSPARKPFLCGSSTQTSYWSWKNVLAFAIKVQNNLKWTPPSSIRRFPSSYQCTGWGLRSGGDLVRSGRGRRIILRGESSTSSVDIDRCKTGILSNSTARVSTSKRKMGDLTRMMRIFEQRRASRVATFASRPYREHARVTTDAPCKMCPSLSSSRHSLFRSTQSQNERNQSSGWCDEIGKRSCSHSAHFRVAFELSPTTQYSSYQEG